MDATGQFGSFATAGQAYDQLATQAEQALSELKQQRDALNTLVQESIQEIDALKAQHSVREGEEWAKVEAARSECQQFKASAFSTEGQLSADAVKEQAAKAAELVRALGVLQEQLAAHQKVRSEHEQKLASQLQRRVKRLEAAQGQVQASAAKLQDCVGKLERPEELDVESGFALISEYGPMVLKVAVAAAVLYSGVRLLR